MSEFYYKSLTLKIYISEKFNGTLERMLLKQVNEDKDDWDELLDHCVFAYNTAVQSTTKYTPFYIMYCR